MRRVLWFALGLLPSPWLLYLAAHRAEDFDARLKRIAAVEKSILECQAAEPRIDEVRRHTAEVKRALVELETILPKTFDPIDLEARIERLAGDQLSLVGFTEIVDKDFYRELPWQVELVGGSADCRPFVEAIENEVSLQEVTGFEIEIDAQGDAHCTVSGRAFGQDLLH